MPTIERLVLDGASPGTNRELVVFRFGKQGRRPSIYLQAGLHADELPGLVVAEHLVGLLTEAERLGRIAGEIVVVPVANPIGLDQMAYGHLIGRFDLDEGTNFNRRYYDLADDVVAAVDGVLTADPDTNLRLARAAIRDALERRRPVAGGGAVASLKHVLFDLASTADLVLDLHCDWEAVMHMYAAERSWPEVSDIARQLGVRAVITARCSGSMPLDEAVSWPWVALAEHAGDRFPLPVGCHGVTVELRGQADVDDVLAAEDAANLFAVMVRRGAISGDPGDLPQALVEPSILEAVDTVRAPASGVIVYSVPVGAHVEKGQAIGYIVNPVAPDAAARRLAFSSATSGVLYGRLAQRFVRAGQVICKVAGRERLSFRSGDLLTA